MGFFSWLISLFKNFFSKSNQRTQKVNKDIENDKEALEIDESRKKIEKDENKNFQILSDSAIEIFRKIHKLDSAKDIKDELVQFVETIKITAQSPGIKVEFSHLKQLNDLWNRILPVIETQFKGDKQVVKAANDISKSIKKLAREIRKQKELLKKDEELTEQKKENEKKEE